ncbi:hypothetical protein JL720_8370 [Aureococcus anophagefferens]|nr:hypothetical protein JL720_8370 [Aureococcus anophagefferens]
MRPKQQSHVHLEESNVRDGDLAILAATNPTVNYLNLRGNPLLSHHGVEKLQHLDRCTHLDLSHCAGVEDKAMEHLRRHTKYLRVLNLSHTNVGDAGIHSFLAGIKLLEELYMRQCPKMTDKGLVEISRQIKLRQVIKVLDLRETLGFSNDALLLLMAEGGGGLHELNLRGCRQIDSLGLLGLRRDVGTLEMRRLDIGGLPHVISGSTLLGGFAGGCRRLRELRLTGLKDAVDDNALQAFAKAAEDSVHGHAPLEVLDLSLCPQISALGLRPFLRAVADTLRDLDVSFCPLLDDAFCGALAPCLQLDRLRAVDTPLISDRGIATWVKGPKVEVDHYAGPAHERIVKRREGEPEPATAGAQGADLEAALTGSVDTSARCRVPRYSERGIRSLAATVIETRHRYKAAGRYYVVFRAARLYEKAMACSALVIQRCIRDRKAVLRGRRLAQEKGPPRRTGPTGARLDDLAIDAAQLLKRRKGPAAHLPSFRRLTLALAFFTFDAYRDYDLWLEVNATFLARWVRKTLARCWRETKYFAALAIQNLGRRRLGGNALERKRREAIARAAKLALEAKIEEALRRQRWEADKLRKDQEQLEREAEERKRRESAMMTALFMKAREESPFETRKRLRRESAQIIQKRARRFVRIVVQHRNKHACKIQGALRAHLARNVVKAAKKRITWIMKAFERFGDPKTVDFLIAARAKRAKELEAEAAQLLLDRAKALRVIQQAIRNRVRRWRAVKYWRDRKEHRYATQIQSRFRLRSARRATLARHRAFNRACFIICHVWGRRKARIQYREIQRKLKQRADEDALQHKVELLRRKNDRKAAEAKALAKRALYHGRVWALKAVKKTITAVKETAKRAWNASMGASEADLVRRGYDLPEIRKDPPHVRLYDLLKDGKSGQQREEESEQVENSVLNLQSRSIKPRGVVDIMITVGRQELASQNEKQDYNKSIKQPVFERIKKDLSTNKSRIYVWYCMGSGPRVLTQFRVRRAPPNHKNKAANESRIFGAYVAGTVIRGHEKLNVEIHGDAGIFRGESAPPIDMINFARNEKEEASYKKLDWELISPTIGSCGDKIGKHHLVIHRKKFHKKVVLNVLALGLLKREKWYHGEERLKDMIAIHALPISSVCALRNVFDKLNYGNSDHWLLELIEIESHTGSHLTFGEYVCAVATLSMFDMIGMLRWLFKSVTGRESCYLEKTDYDLLTKGLLANNPLPYQQVHVDTLFETFSSGKGEIYFEDWAAIMKQNLGEGFWFKKKLEFDSVRDMLGVERAGMMN